MSVLKVHDFLLVLLLSPLELKVPVLVEILVLLDVGLLDFFLLLLVGEHELLELHVILLLLELCNSILRHFSL